MFAERDVSNWFEYFAVLVEAVQCHAVGDFRYFFQWIFRVFIDYMADNMVYDIFLRGFCLCGSTYWKMQTVSFLFPGSCCRSGASGWAISFHGRGILAAIVLRALNDLLAKNVLDISSLHLIGHVKSCNCSAIRGFDAWVTQHDLIFLKESSFYNIAMGFLWIL